MGHRGAPISFGSVRGLTITNHQNFMELWARLARSGSITFELMVTKRNQNPKEIHSSREFLQTIVD